MSYKGIEKNKILIIGYNFHPELTGIGRYTGEKVLWLAKRGYDCTVVTSYPYYPYWKVQEPYFKHRFKFSKEQIKFSSGGSILTYRCPIYVPSNPTGFKRILLDVSFFITALMKVLQLIIGQKFHSILTVVPAFQFGLLGILYKKLRGAKLYYHVQDLQIEAARDLKMIQSKYLLKYLFKVEKYILMNADVISSISEGMIRKIEEKAGKNVMYLPNWVDINKFYPLKNKQCFKKHYGFSESDKIFMYSGAVGEKQGIEAILYAAERLKQNKNIKFVICGSGPYKEKLINKSKFLGLTNVHFLPLQPPQEFNKFLNMADVHLVIQKANAGDLVMPSKLTTILAVGGVALITANKDTTLYKLVDTHNMGILIDAEDQEALLKGVQLCIKKNTEDIAVNARQYAISNLAIDIVMGKFDESLQGESINLE
jgi:colanic acid biosynthesis glycosyl transferase WcaI